MRKIIFILMLLSCYSLSYAESVPRHVSADKRVKIVMYDPNNVVILNGSYGYETQITFAANETIKNVSVGDSLAWQVTPVTNNLFIKPVTASKTNMAILTDLNSYIFELNSLTKSATPTYKLQFIYPDGGYDTSGTANAIATFDPDKLNWKYSFTGDRSLAPIEAFDNNQFTYFKFKQDGMARLPAVFIVDKDRNETLVNFHMQKQYMVIHSIAKQFTLRNGSIVTSIYNDLAIGDWKNIA